MTPSTGGGRPVALVTGGAHRVGLAISRALSRAGLDLVITSKAANTQRLLAVSDLSRDGSLMLERIDLADPAAVRDMAARLARDLPRLDVIVHNASIYAPTPLAEVTADDALEHYRVNALAPLLLSKHLAPRLAESPLPGGGAIVAMCDMHALGRPRRDFSAYAMSKAALVEMVRTLARDLAPRVRVNGVAPGVVAFPESGYESDAEAQRAYVSRVPLARAGTPDDAAEVVRWLALDARYTTGEIVRVDGGRWLA